MGHAAIVLPNGQTRDLGVREVDLEETSEEAQAQAYSAKRLLVESAGQPAIRIVFDAETGGANITAVGLEPANVPLVLVQLAEHMVAEA